MSHSKSKYIVNPLEKRIFAIRFEISTSPEMVANMLDAVNEQLAQLPGEGYIHPYPEIEMEGMCTVEVYYLYSDTVCWDALRSRRVSFMPDVESKVFQTDGLQARMV